jgi:hypothetical protein
MTNQNTTTSLREEIERYLGSCGCTWTIKPVYADEILKLFEKRINKLIEIELKNLRPTEECLGKLRGLRWVKEMLKE